MSIDTKSGKFGNFPYRLKKLKKYWRPTRGNYMICSFGLSPKLPKFKGRLDTKELRARERLCYLPAQAMCTNCNTPYCSVHLERHMLVCWR